MKIVIYGLSKTGTSARLSNLRRCYPSVEWTLRADAPTDPVHGPRDVGRLIGELRAQANLPPLLPRGSC